MRKLRLDIGAQGWDSNETRCHWCRTLCEDINVGGPQKVRQTRSRTLTSAFLQDSMPMAPSFKSKLCEIPNGP